MLGALALDRTNRLLVAVSASGVVVVDTLEEANSLKYIGLVSKGLSLEVSPVGSKHKVERLMNKG